MGRDSRAHGAGTIAVLSGELARFSRFARALVRIERPDNTQLDWAETIDIGKARNLMVETFLKTNGQWLWFLDDDMVTEHDTLTRLLATPTEIVQPLVLMRRPPHPPTFYDAPNAITKLYPQRFLESGMTLVPVEACGTGGMLIRRHVLEGLTPPWFEIGRILPDSLGEDLFFCGRARAAGFTIHVDTTIHMGHITTVELWPHRAQLDGKEAWMTEVRFSGRSLMVDAATTNDV